MVIVFRFVARAAFSVLWLAFVVVVLAAIVALLALSAASALCLLWAAIYGLLYWHHPDHEMASAVRTMLLFGLGGCGIVMGLEGMVWDAFRAAFSKNKMRLYL